MKARCSNQVRACSASYRMAAGVSSNGIPIKVRAAVLESEAFGACPARGLGQRPSAGLVLRSVFVKREKNLPTYRWTVKAGSKVQATICLIRMRFALSLYLVCYASSFRISRVSWNPAVNLQRRHAQREEHEILHQRPSSAALFHCSHTATAVKQLLLQESQS